MEDQERQIRLQTASALVTLLKQHGGSARFAAEWLNVSPTTISNWHRLMESKTRKQGVPSDEQLRKLVTLVSWQVRQAMGGVRFLLDQDLIRTREGIILTRSLVGGYREMADTLVAKCEEATTMLQGLRDLVEKHGPRALDFILQPIEVRWDPDRPAPDTSPAPPHVDADALFRETEVTDDDTLDEDTKLQTFFAARNQRFLEGAAQRARKRKRAKK